MVDLRWIAPLPLADVLRAAAATGLVLVADETRQSGGVSEEVVAALADAGFAGRVLRVTSKDSFIPRGDAAATVLLSETLVELAARELVKSNWSNRGPAWTRGDPRLGVVRRGAR